VLGLILDLLDLTYWIGAPVTCDFGLSLCLPHHIAYFLSAWVGSSALPPPLVPLSGACRARHFQLDQVSEQESSDRFRD